MDIRQIEALVKEAVRDADLHAAQIPAIDLYVDQITSLTSDKLKEGAERFHDRVLTKTMINNYSKDGLISPIKGKKYSKDQILQMLLVYSLKNTLSIGEIKRILQNIYALPSYDGKMLEDTYERFLSIKENERGEVWEMLQEFIKKNELDIADDAGFFTMILGLASISAYIKNVVQALLEARYPDLNAEKERVEQEKKDETKRRKEEKKEEKKAAKAKEENTAVESELQA
ncbi:MAG: DUF1836 domain-containing protein [Clostridia bacterium]|nr:DUF1836 domain-containing protein [Clostridia bacterium]